jgi:predicted nucleic acid-binding protein
MTDVFLDSVGLIAIWNSADQWHGAASAAYDSLRSRDINLYTTNSVLLECGMQLHEDHFVQAL